MVKFYDEVPEDLRKWAMEQPLFFTATAPLTGKHINVSPKGLTGEMFRVTSGSEAMYIDTTGSGSETIAHLYENGRITLMFCSFDKSPRILRFFCRGSVVERDSPLFEGLLQQFGHKSKDMLPGARAVIKLDIFKASSSCGYGVPMLVVDSDKAQVKEEDGSEDGEGSRFADYMKERDIIPNWAVKMSSSGKLGPYQRQNNTWSLDGCTGLKMARKASGQWLWVSDGLVWVKRVVIGEWEAVLVGMLLMFFLTITSRNLSVMAI